MTGHSYYYARRSQRGPWFQIWLATELEVGGIETLEMDLISTATAADNLSFKMNIG